MPLPVTTIQVETEIALDHRVYFLAASHSGRIVACSLDGEVSVVGAARGISRKIHLKSNVEGISLSADGERLAIVLEDRIEIRNTDTDAIELLPGKYNSAYFDDNGQLWTARHSSTDTIRIEVFSRLTRVLEGEIEDPFGNSSLGFPDQPRDAPIPLWIAAGQDGQTLSWVSAVGNELDVSHMDELVECGPPTVSQWSDEFLLFEDADVLSRFSLFDFERLNSGQLNSPSGDNQGFGLSIVYISPVEALVLFEDGRMYQVNIDTMSLNSEVVIAGHEPRPTRELYPSLPEDELCSDVTSILTVNGQILSIHAELPAREFKQRGTLVWWLSSE